MKGFSEISEPSLVWTGKVMLEGRIAVPRDPVAAVVFASAPSLADDARDEQLALELFALRIAVLYVPLLTDDEFQFDSRTTHFRFDADFLGQRFIEVAQWLSRNRTTAGLPLAFVATSGGAAGAMVAAALRRDVVSAVVSIDGRTDLASEYLRFLRTPTLLLVRDMPVLRMNREALTRIRGDRRIEIVHGTDAASLDAVVQKSVHWIEEKLALLPVLTAV
jgi:putative phosphoribosyl transferase